MSISSTNDLIIENISAISDYNHAQVDLIKKTNNMMNSTFDMRLLSNEIEDARPIGISGSQLQYDTTPQQPGAHISRSSVVGTSTNGSKRQKDISPCYVCGAKAHGYNFDQSNP